MYTGPTLAEHDRQYDRQIDILSRWIADACELVCRLGGIPATYPCSVAKDCCAPHAWRTSTMSASKQLQVGLYAPLLACTAVRGGAHIPWTCTVCESKGHAMCA